MAGPKGGRSFRKRCTLNMSITPAKIITSNCRNPLAAPQLVALGQAPQERKYLFGRMMKVQS